MGGDNERAILPLLEQGREERGDDGAVQVALRLIDEQRRPRIDCQHGGRHDDGIAFAVGHPLDAEGRAGALTCHDFDVIRVLQRNPERARPQEVVQPRERRADLGDLLGKFDLSVLYMPRDRAGPLVLGGHEVEEDGRMGLGSTVVSPEASRAVS